VLPGSTILHQRVWCLTLALLVAAACRVDGAPRACDEAMRTTPASDTGEPVGLAIEIDNGVGQPLQIHKRQRFYLNQIDLRASV
jgi:hypothetical protein